MYVPTYERVKAQWKVSRKSFQHFVNILVDKYDFEARGYSKIPVQ